MKKKREGKILIRKQMADRIELKKNSGGLKFSLKFKTVSLVDLFNDLHKRAKLLFIFDESELTSKEIEMLEASVKMSFNTKLAELIQMAVIHMSINTEKTLVNGTKSGHQLLGWGGTIREHFWEDSRIIKNILDPRHEKIDVLGSRNSGGLGIILAALPQVLVGRTSAHGWA